MNKLEGIVNSTVFNFRKTQSEILEILKARPIKYYKRIPTGNPNRPYKYFYTKNQFDKFTKVQQAVEKKKPVVQVSELDNQIAEAQEKLRIHRDNSNPENKKLSEQEWETKLRSLQDEYRNLLKQKSIKDKSHTLTELEKLTFQRVHGVEAPDTIPVDSSGKFESQWVQSYISEKKKIEKNETIKERLELLGFEIDPVSEVKNSTKYIYRNEESGEEIRFFFHPSDPNGDWTWSEGKGKLAFYSYISDSRLESQLKGIEKRLKKDQKLDDDDLGSDEETLFSYADKVKDSVLEKKIEIEKKNYEG